MMMLNIDCSNIRTLRRIGFGGKEQVGQNGVVNPDDFFCIGGVDSGDFLPIKIRNGNNMIP